MVLGRPSCRVLLMAHLRKAIGVAASIIAVGVLATRRGIINLTVRKAMGDSVASEYRLWSFRFFPCGPFFTGSWRVQAAGVCFLLFGFHV